MSKTSYKGRKGCSKLSINQFITVHICLGLLHEQQCKTEENLNICHKQLYILEKSSSGIIDYA